MKAVNLTWKNPELGEVTERVGLPDGNSPLFLTEDLEKIFDTPKSEHEGPVVFNKTDLKKVTDLSLEGQTLFEDKHGLFYVPTDSIISMEVLDEDY